MQTLNFQNVKIDTLFLKTVESKKRDGFALDIICKNQPCCYLQTTTKKIEITRSNLKNINLIFNAN